MPNIEKDIFYRQVTIESIGDDELKSSSSDSLPIENDCSFFLHRRPSNRGELNFNENPEIFIRPKMIKPIVYKKIVTVKFLKPPEICRGPLIIRKVHSEAPRPPLPSVIQLYRWPCFHFRFSLGRSTNSFTSVVTRNIDPQGKTATDSSKDSE